MSLFSPVPITVSSGSGRFVHDFGDITVFTKGMPLFLGRTFASENQNRPGLSGWSWSFDERLLIFQNQAIHRGPDGVAVVYQDDGDGYRPTMSHNTTELHRLSDRIFEVRYQGGGKTVYEIPSGLEPDPEKPVPAVPTKTYDTFDNLTTFRWDTTGTRLLRMQGSSPRHFIALHWECREGKQLLTSAQNGEGYCVAYRYRKMCGPQGETDFLLSKVLYPGRRTIEFRYHALAGQRQYELLDVLANGLLQEKVVANPRIPGQLKEVTHRPDVTMTFERTVDPDNGRTFTTFRRRAASSDTPEGVEQFVRYELDEEDRVVAAQDASDYRVEYEFGPNDDLVHALDNQGREIRANYDDRHHPLEIVDQDGRRQQMEYLNDDLVAVVDNLGRRTTITYSSHLPISITDPLGHTSSMTYSADGTLLSYTDRNGNTTTFEHDPQGFLEAVVLPATAQNGPARTRIQRDVFGRAQFVEDALGRKVSFEHDFAGRVVGVTLPAVSAKFRQEALPAAHSRSIINRDDLLESTRAVDGRVTRYRYDQAQRLVEVQETGYPAPTRLVYDSFDNLKSVIRPNGATTTYTHDRLNRVTRVQYPGGDEESLQYDGRGRVSQWVRGSQVVFYEYDNVDRLVRMHCPATGDDFRYTFDSVDRLTAMEDQTGTTTYGYTDNDLVERITRPDNRVQNYFFDPGDRLIRSLDPEGLATEYEFNERNQLIQARHDNQTVNYSYDILGRATLIQLPNGVQGQQVFDERDRLLFRHYRNCAGPLVSLKYAYNQLGQRILDDRTMPNGNQLARFFYNKRLELVKSVRDRGGCGPDEVHTYAYDLNHNWTKKDGVSYTNNIADQLLAVGGGGSLSYNDSGQATDIQGWDVTYNCADQITGLTAPGKNIVYRYDGAGQRVEKSVNGVTQKFLWNGGDICKEYGSDGSVRADYFLGAGREGIKTNGQWHWYLSDIQGSTLMLTDASGHAAATYDYSDYGETRQTSGSTALYNPFLYTGQEYDFETSLYHLRARHYSPANGRFFSRDPIGYAGGSNLYAYCGADPVNCSDPSGLYAEVCGSGNDLTIKLSMFYWSNSLKPPQVAEAAAKFNEAIIAMWGGRHGKYNVTIKLDMKTSGGAKVNAVQLFTGTGESRSARGGTAHVWYAGQPSLTGAHEAGHLMGLIDRYRYDDPSVPTSPEYWDNIMGPYKYLENGQQPRVFESDITDIVNYWKNR